MSSEAQYSLADFYFTDTDDPMVPPPEFGKWVQDGAWAFELFEPEMLGAVEPVMRIHRAGKDRTVVNLSSYNYLGLAAHPEVIEAGKKALSRYGTGACGSPMLSGMTDLHRQLEHELRKFTGHEDVMLFNSGFGGGMGTLTGLLRKGDVAILDDKCHLCLIDGVKLAKAKLNFFTHNDPAALDEALQKTAGRRRVVVLEGVYSMDGDTANLPALLEVTERHGVGVMLDEAHSILALGARGRGCAEHYGLPPSAINLQYATFSKSFAHTGSFVAGKKELIKYLRHYVNGYAFSCALPPAIVGGVLKALELGTRDNSLREKLWRNVQHFRAGAESLGLDIGEADSQVFPIIIGGDRQMLYEQCIAMNDAGLFLAPVDFPSVPEESLRYRVAVTAGHELVDLDRALNILEDTLVKALREAGTLGEVREPRPGANGVNGTGYTKAGASASWQTMAKFMYRQASAIANSSNKRARIAQLSSMAYDHFVERARDPSTAYDRLIRATSELNLRDAVSTLREIRRERA
ncbi:POSSIBLE 8-AMINO-7-OXONONANOATE SYNTHASE BIOF2 (AONS) (8-AMINO-7-KETOPELARGONATE SYNTHASE) [Plesiocystis pacifica SIR-1]|uniref:POSSIBLE 8-AMINO-7-OXONONANOATE SYNTHASE BIOF2 (AONS) (8-AMINO-7-KETOPELARGONATE SYNTHASE) n=1 Tax=Plesiocystis pacifica SIR-1 TaxID=391625 RepID=A6G7N2_9BACT|nr:aminotransferase class I/II-fold pyridoxal phosphate-dependent enzyme [Plesiocystis pacifica]EDM78110.1 POSSIBLE 8-AMINO-7-OXONONANOATE SYNTHASE BIOF2 (AONS) (8-AMINO-7-KETOPELARGONATE SYNTHASE) [Plesiocystis pacifica SIR-1]